MTRDLMLHIEETLSSDERLALMTHLRDRFELTGEIHPSTKPHLLFVPGDPARVPSHALVEAVRRFGYHAQAVDL
jgi:hypothetical protein